MAKAIGNSMHVNSIGACIRALFFRSPRLVRWDCTTEHLLSFTLLLTPSRQLLVATVSGSESVAADSNAKQVKRSSFGGNVAALLQLRRKLSQ